MYAFILISHESGAGDNMHGISLLWFQEDRKYPGGIEPTLGAFIEVCHPRCWLMKELIKEILGKRSSDWQCQHFSVLIPNRHRQIARLVHSQALRQSSQLDSPVHGAIILAWLGNMLSPDS